MKESVQIGSKSKGCGTRFDVKVLLEYVQKNTRIASVRAAMEEIREAV
jgi:hypothetical protein